MYKAFVVNDGKSTRFSFRKFLTDAKFDVIAASHPIDARAIMAANEFD
ncbi:MAG: hypothetical protein JRJ42_10850 [Deltaproteobacteria bacterium]|nr:hypothetical protein [Deltaproteobacteria bacterium]MBW2021073.1 hypothetical protein [Deltaproteobacteria bacterium]MBW2075758.1 hypothetical protein [Deltaproteobacteria bacterium]